MSRAQRRAVPHRGGGRDQHRHAFAHLGPVLSLGDRRIGLPGRRRAVHPAATLMLGAGLIAAGLVRAYLATQLPADQPRFMVFLAAAVTILLGLIIVSHWPLDSVYVLGTLLGVDLLFHGVGWVSFGMRLHSRS